LFRIAIMFLTFFPRRSWCIESYGGEQEQKKPTWQNTRRHSTTSAYSSTRPPAGPGCSLSSHPTISLENGDQLRRNPSTVKIVRR
jgi:hypothetical protein